MLTRQEMQDALEAWKKACDEHDLEGVKALVHEEMFFENWTGKQAKGKETLRAVPSSPSEAASQSKKRPSTYNQVAVNSRTGQETRPHNHPKWETP